MMTSRRARMVENVRPASISTPTARFLNYDLARKTFYQLDVGAFQRRLQIGIGGGPATAMMDRLLHRAEAFLLLAIIVFRHLETCLMAGLDKGVKQRIVALAALDVERAIGAAPAILSAMRVFHALEIGQHIGIGPAARAVFRPVVVIPGVAAHIDHAVDRGRPAQHLAARRYEAAPADMRFRLGGKAPVIGFHVHGEGEGGRHLDQRADIRHAIFYDDHRITPVFRQAIGHGRTGGAGADDDEICFHTHFSPKAAEKAEPRYSLPPA